MTSHQVVGLTLNLRHVSYGERSECTPVLEQRLKLIVGYT